MEPGDKGINFFQNFESYIDCAKIEFGTNLLEEVVVLSERISAMEGDINPDQAQERINKIVERVLAPLSR